MRSNPSRVRPDSVTWRPGSHRLGSVFSTIGSVSFNRVLKYLNILIAVVAVLILAGVYWWAYRPLPQVSGTIAAFLSGRATAARDSLGVPHILAQSDQDAYFVQGYVTAQDRMFQMDSLRRRAAGELAEIVGPAALELDRESRRLRMRRMAEQAYGSLPAHDKSAISAYVRGVNEYLIHNRGRLGLEYSVLRYEPRPWTGADSMLVVMEMFRVLTSSWRSEITKRNMLRDGDAEKVNLLFSLRGGGEIAMGSNAWVISGKHTASRKPLLANDPHLEYSVPGIWHRVHIQAPGLKVAGAIMPGLPGVIIGHNDRIAWGVTNLGFDVQDLYEERIDERTGRYEYQGKTEQGRPERDVILIRGAPPQDSTLWVTRHGPLFAGDGDKRLSLRWLPAELGTVQYPIPQLNRAANWEEFQAALARYAGPAQNFVFADVEGNIGYHVAGWLPIRKGHRGDVPADGPSGKSEWEGFIPFEVLPHAFNPPSGIIVTANQNPFPDKYPYAVNGSFAPRYRQRQIYDRLARRNGWRADEMLAVQKDVYSAFDHALARELVGASDRQKAGNTQLAPAVSVLRKWNGQMEKDQSAPMITTLAFQHLRKAIAERAAPGKGVNYQGEVAAAAVEKLLESRLSGWFNGYDDALLKSFAEAVEEGQRMQGRDPAKWIYGKRQEVLIAHPVGHRLPLVSGLFDIGPVEMSGSPLTVKQTTTRVAPSMRMVVDLGDFDRSVLVLQIGESGHVLSRNYRNQWDAYYAGRGLPWKFRDIDRTSVVEFLPGK